MLDQQGDLHIPLNVSVPQFHSLGTKRHWEKSTLHPPMALIRGAERGSCGKWLITSRKRKENPEANSDSYEDVFCNDFCTFRQILSPLPSFPLLYSQLISPSQGSNASCSLSGFDSEFQRDAHAFEIFSDVFLNKLCLRNNDIPPLSQDRISEAEDVLPQN